uniref:Uncharacterized protein n=1 Tax=Arundo donax TaxID=35708 RepID=A0A0A9G0G5_ARUDO
MVGLAVQQERAYVLMLAHCQ